MGFKNLQDLLAGLLFIAFGAAALWYGKGYPVGVATKMGPGFMPMALGWLLVGIGTIIAIKAFVTQGTPIPSISMRPQIMIIAALIGFALTIERFGLLVAAAVVVVLGSLASRDVRIVETIVIAVLTALAAVGLFIYVLGQPMSAWVGGY